MEYIPVSFLAGILTVLAPCVFPMLPIILGGSLGAKNLVRPFVVIVSLALSVIIFTLGLKVFVIGISQETLRLFSVGIIFFFGITLLFPHLWEIISVKLKINSASSTMLQKNSQKQGFFGWILLGISLGPVFSACSPTYFLIVGTVLPQNFVVGLINLLFYGLGLFLILFLVAFFGQKITKNLSWASQSDGWLKKIFGIIFISMAIGIYMGYDKVFESWLLDSDFFYNLATIESKIVGE